MAISVQILGQRGGDSGALITVDTGQHVSYLLFDCGEDTVSRLPFWETARIDHVLFSHFHMDHVAGFDVYFRRHFDRSDRVNHIWGPPGTAELMGHRFKGFVWNLVDDRKAAWMCHDIGEDAVTATRYELNECFATGHAEHSSSTPTVLMREHGYQVEAVRLNHGIPSIGYVIREDERMNVDAERLRSLGLKQGPWLKTLSSDTVSVIDGVAHDSEELRSALLVRTPGDAMALLTDFIAEGAEQERIASHLQGVRTLVCECQYRIADEPLARKNFHMTTRWVGELAARVAPRRLILTHFSDRYELPECEAMGDEVRALFPFVELA